MSTQSPAIAKTPSLLAYGCAAVGLAGGFVLLPALSLSASLLMLPLGATVGAGIAIALPSHDAEGNHIKKPLQQKIVDGFLGAFVGAIGATLIPASALAALGATAGYGIGSTVSRVLDRLTGTHMQRPVARDASPVTVPDTATSSGATALKSGLSNSFTTGRASEATVSVDQRTPQQNPAKPR